MPYCRYCGVEIRSTDAYCYNCGKAKGRSMDVVINPARIIIVCILSFGFYLFYWYYLTWKHYRDYTKNKVYPIWHALSQLVPFYGYFIAYDHVRSYKELMNQAGTKSTLNPGLFVILYIISNILSIFSMRPFLEHLSGVILINVSIIGIVACILVWVQTNLNRYWKNAKDISTIQARIGVGEVIFIILGILAWIGTFFPET